MATEVLTREMLDAIRRANGMAPAARAGAVGGGGVAAGGSMANPMLSKLGNTGAFGAVGGEAAAVGGEQAATTMMEKLKAMFGKGGKAAGAGLPLGGILLGLLFDQAVNQIQTYREQGIQGNLQEQGMAAQGAAMTPENAQAQARLPVAQSQNQAALYMLMQQLGGGSGNPMLAPGEALT